MLTFSHTSEMSHCPTICPHQNGTLVAYYAGFECTDTQHVEIQYSEGNNILAKHILPFKTGNPVLIPKNKNEATLICSFFNDSNEITNGGFAVRSDIPHEREVPRTPVERWGFCTNWKARVRFRQGKIEILDSTILRINPLVGLLMRCNPIKIGRQFLLPYYHELGHWGGIAHSINGWDWATAGRDWATASRIGFQPKRSPKEQAYFGTLIQPTLWHDKKRGLLTIYALCRDVTPAHKAWFSTSVDMGETWSDPKTTSIDNYNNSIVALDSSSSSRDPWIIWNKGFGRFALCLGKWHIDTGEITPQTQLNPVTEKAAYPNYCWVGDQLHIVHTQNNRIVHHIISKEMLHG